MVHGHVRTEVSNAHRYLVEKGSQRLPLLLADTDQGNGGQMERATCGDMRLKLVHQCREVVDGVGKELREPAENSSLQPGQHSTLKKETSARQVGTLMRCFNYESGLQGGWPRSQATSGSESSHLTRRRLERSTSKSYSIHCRMIALTKAFLDNVVEVPG